MKEDNKKDLSKNKIGILEIINQGQVVDSESEVH